MPAPKDDAILKAAVDLAREAADSIAEDGTVGEHLGMEMVDERLATHYFACTATAYPGWRWAITVARVPRGKAPRCARPTSSRGRAHCSRPSGCPYAERLAPGDLGAGDVLPYKEEDPHLEPGFEATGDEDVDQMAALGARTRSQARPVGGGPGGRGTALVRGRGRPPQRGRREGPGPLFVVRVLPPDGGCPALFFRRVRQRLVTQRRSRRES